MFWYINQRNILIFKANLVCHNSSILTSITTKKAQCLYREAVINCPFVMKVHLTISSSLLSWTFPSISYHSNLSGVLKFLLKVRLISSPYKTLATIQFCCLHISNNLFNLIFRGILLATLHTKTSFSYHLLLHISTPSGMFLYSQEVLSRVVGILHW
jgi:hypothetical protein